MLHMLLKSPYLVDIYEFLHFFSKEDDFVALQDGVLIVLKNNLFYKKFIKIVKNRYVLKNDLLARGLSSYNNKFSIINYKDLVYLTEKNIQQIIWK
ncbi:sulfurtransferase complex subunit TusB [Buchnera aphidicola]|uniref:sulfurtransferase complex subunit TusB n=1 Tax=Buchnera aphidicola TaxID=9 RepID=UPI0030EC927A